MHLRQAGGSLGHMRRGGRGGAHEAGGGGPVRLQVHSSFGLYLWGKGGGDSIIETPGYSLCELIMCDHHRASGHRQ